MPASVLGGRYTVQDKIGTGGMAIVYRGLDKVLGRTVAIKTMLPQYAADPSFAARFKQEAQAAAALQSPYIVSVYDWGKDGDTYYIIMEYLRGTDLKSGIRKHGALDCRKVAQIGSQIAQALSVAHRHDIIHRDIKPQNIMVQPDGNIKVMDFGIARAKNSHLTADNSVLGTAHYVSPEQTQGKELGPTTDIYSLGIVMYEAATGRVPFDGDDAISVALKQVNEQPKPPSQINPRVDPALESIILKCMQKNPADRFQTADALYRVLRDYLAGRLQQVNNATAVIAPVSSTAAIHAAQGNSSGAQRMRSAGDISDTNRHRRDKSATAEAERRSRRRSFITGFLVVAIAAIAIALAAMFFSSSSQVPTHLVPNYIGMTEEEAIEAIENTDYFTYTIKREYSDEYDEGYVVDQTPNANKDAEEGTEILLVISKGAEPAEDVEVPDLTNLDASEANALLAQYGLIGSAGDAVYSSEVESGKVAEQSPKAGSTAKAGDTITYYLSKGIETVEVPSVVGYTEDSARSMLESAGFVVATTSEASDAYASGVVSYQSVTGTAAKGSTVTITVSTGSTTAEVPYVVGWTQSSAASAIANAGFDYSIADDSTSGAAAGTVTNQSAYGTTTKGTTIILYVSTGSSSSSDTDTGYTDDTTVSDGDGYY